ncbi:MAG TPA: type IV secretory system conjugative DNA transfer family protein [Lysobacter sp.]
MTSNQTKAGFAVTLLLLATLGGVYFSGFLTLLLLKLQTPLQLDTYWQYWQALNLPQVAPYVKKIKLAGAIGFGLPLLGWVLALIPMFKSRSAESLHGDARLATRADIAQAGLYKQTPEGVLIGDAFGQNVYLGGAQHVIVTAATRTGKTAGIVVPILLTYRQSVVCSDLKGELYDLTSAQRQAMGHAVYRYAPYDEQGRTHRFNPFTALSTDRRVLIGDIQTIGAVLYPDDPNKDPFWTSQARSAFLAFALFLFDNWYEVVDTERAGIRAMHGRDAAPDELPDRNADIRFPSFERIYKLASGSGGESVQAMIQRLLTDPAYEFMSEQARTNFSALAGLAEQTFSSAIASMQEPLMQFANPILASATNASDFDVRQLRKRPMSVFMVIPPQKLGESSKLMNIFFSVVIGGNLDRTPQEDPSNRHQILLVLDEFATMGRVNALSDRISIMGGYGVRSLVIVQSRAQLRAVYGADSAQNLITNHAASIVFTPREQDDANEYSEMLGYRTIRKEHRSISRGAGGSSVSTNTTEERRALMLPQELKELPKDDELIFFEGCRPIRAHKNWYFKDKAFTALIAAPVGVQPAKSGGGE